MKSCCCSNNDSCSCSNGNDEVTIYSTCGCFPQPTLCYKPSPPPRPPPCCCCHVKPPPCCCGSHSCCSSPQNEYSQQSSCNCYSQKSPQCICNNSPRCCCYNEPQCKCSSNCEKSRQRKAKRKSYGGEDSEDELVEDEHDKDEEETECSEDEDMEEVYRKRKKVKKLERNRKATTNKKQKWSRTSDKCNMCQFCCNKTCNMNPSNDNDGQENKADNRRTNQTVNANEAEEGNKDSRMRKNKTNGDTNAGKPQDVPQYTKVTDEIKSQKNGNKNMYGDDKSSIKVANNNYKRSSVDSGNLAKNQQQNNVNVSKKGAANKPNSPGGSVSDAVSQAQDRKGSVSSSDKKRLVGDTLNQLLQGIPQCTNATNETRSQKSENKNIYGDDKYSIKETNNNYKRSSVNSSNLKKNQQQDNVNTSKNVAANKASSPVGSVSDEVGQPQNRKGSVSSSDKRVVGDTLNQLLQGVVQRTNATNGVRSQKSENKNMYGDENLSIKRANNNSKRPSANFSNLDKNQQRDNVNTTKKDSLSGAANKAGSSGGSVGDQPQNRRGSVSSTDNNKRPSGGLLGDIPNQLQNKINKNGLSTVRGANSVPEEQNNTNQKGSILSAFFKKKNQSSTKQPQIKKESILSAFTKNNKDSSNTKELYKNIKL